MIHSHKDQRQLLIAQAAASNRHSPPWLHSGLVRSVHESPQKNMNRIVHFATEVESSRSNHHSIRYNEGEDHEHENEDIQSNLSLKFIKLGNALTCGLSKYLPPLCKEEEWHTLVLNFKAAIAIYSSIIFWVGTWDILSEPMSRLAGGGENDSNDPVYVLLAPSFQRELLYFFSGIFLMMITDTLYGNAGMPGTYFPETCHWNEHVVIFRVIFGLVGSVLTWTGLYNILDGYTVEQSFLRDVCAALIGFIGLAATDTFYDMAFVYPPGTNSDDIITSRSKFSSHLIATLRALLSIIFQNFVWLGCFNTLEYYMEGSVWREITFGVTGIFLFWATNSFVPNSWIIVSKDGQITQLSNINLLDIDAEANDKITLEHYVVPHTPTFAFYARALIALAAQVMHNTGVWVLVDEYFAESSLVRNCIYVFAGLFLLWYTGVLLANAGITPLITPIWEPPTVPSAGELALVASAIEEEEYDLIDASVLHSAASIMPAARGRLRRRQIETDLDDLAEDRVFSQDE